MTEPIIGMLKDGMAPMEVWDHRFSYETAKGGRVPVRVQVAVRPAGTQLTRYIDRWTE